MIYAIGNEDGYVKIGITRSNIKNRLSSIQTGSSTKLRILKTWELVGDNADRAGEKKLHRHLVKYRSNGEWFFLPQDRVDWLLDCTEEYFSTEDAPKKTKIRSTKTRAIRLSDHAWAELKRLADEHGLRGRAEYLEMICRKE